MISMRYKRVVHSGITWASVEAAYVGYLLILLNRLSLASFGRDGRVDYPAIDRYAYRRQLGKAK